MGVGAGPIPQLGVPPGTVLWAVHSDASAGFYGHFTPVHTSRSHLQKALLPRFPGSCSSSSEPRGVLWPQVRFLRPQGSGVVVRSRRILLRGD